MYSSFYFLKKKRKTKKRYKQPELQKGALLFQETWFLNNQIFMSKDPYITSYGLIVYYPENKVNKYVIYQQRDTYEYIDFVQGNWVDYDDIYFLFSKMSFPERERIRNYTIEELCNDLWVKRDTKYFRDMFPRAKKKYETIVADVQHFLDSTTTVVVQPQWGFPKGKKQSKEANKKCALREFKEETSMRDIRITILNTSPYREEFVGSNNKFYRTIYYVAKADKMHEPGIIYTNDAIRKTSVSPEAMDVKWVSLLESKQYISLPRYEILRKVEEFLNDKKIP